jgi:hypothetical protein
MGGVGNYLCNPASRLWTLSLTLFVYVTYGCLYGLYALFTYLVCALYEYVYNPCMYHSNMISSFFPNNHLSSMVLRHTQLTGKAPSVHFPCA